MPQSHNASSVAKIVLDTCVAAKIDMINDLPAMPVSGDLGNGYFCIPASVDDLAWLAHVPENGRANVLSFALRGAMQKAQAALKAVEKKNKDASEETRLNAAQTAFAGALNGSVASSFNDSSLIRAEAQRQMVETQVKPYVVSLGKDTDEKTLEAYRAQIEKDMGADYKAAMDSLVASVATSRTYAVSRKTTTADGAKPEIAAFKFAAKSE